MAGCIAANDGDWFLCLEACVAFPILKALNARGDMVRCISSLIYFCTGTVSRFMRGWSWIYVYQCMLELAA